MDTAQVSTVFWWKRPDNKQSELCWTGAICMVQIHTCINSEEGGRILNTANKTFNNISENDKVMLDIRTITSRKNYARRADEYKAFINNSSGRVFTAHVEHPTLISLKEEPRWLFWSGDLVKIDVE